MKPCPIQRVLGAASLLSLAAVASAQQCPIAIDADPVFQQNSSDVSSATDPNPQLKEPGLVKFNGEWFFSATDHTNGGREFYKTDGTHAGTVLVKNINQGGYTLLGDLCTTPNRLFFTVNDDAHGRELWTTDGTTGGTVLVKDITPGSTDSSIHRLTSMGTGIVFVAINSATGSELWTSDGTAAGTFLISDIYPGSKGSNPIYMAFDASSATVYFTADDGVHGHELWRTDGTPAGTTMVKDITSGPSNSLPEDLVVWNGKVYFTADTPGIGRELWSSDGTAAGTTLVKDILPGSNGSDLELKYAEDFNGLLFFNADDGKKGLELWATDGSSAGTRRIADVNPGPGDSDPFGMQASATHLLFHAIGGSQVGREPFVMDLNGSVQMLVDIAPGATNSTLKNKFSNTISGGQFVWTARPQGLNQGPTELWVSDGTPAGTRSIPSGLISGGFDNISELTNIGGSSVVFIGSAIDFDKELCISDLTSAGSQILKQINPPKELPAYSKPNDFYSKADQELVFRVLAGVSERETWSWSAQKGGAQGASFLPAGSGYDALDTLHTWLNGQAMTFFTNKSYADSFSDYFSLFVSTGNPASAFKVPGSTFRFARGFTRMGNHVYYIGLVGADEYGQDGKHALFKSDGTEAGSSLVHLFPFGTVIPSTSPEQPLFLMGGKLCFLATVQDWANPSLNTSQLWTTDGTAAGTVLVPISLPYKGANALIVFQERLYFTLHGSQGVTLWVTDGTSAGTQVISQTGLAFAGGVTETAILGDKLLFSAEQKNARHELHVTDGTPAGTQMLASFDNGFTTEGIQLTEPINGLVFIAVSRASSTPEIWVTDGTAGGTTFVVTVPGATPGTKITDLVVYGSGAYFAAETPANGSELWHTDGTQAGTQMYCDLNPGPDSSSPEELTLVDGSLLFAAFTPSAGREVFHVPAVAPYVANLGNTDENGGQLTSSTATMGGNFTVEATSVPQGNVSVLVMSAPASTPSGLFTNGESGSWIDLPTATMLNINTSANWTWSTPVPLIPSLVGIKIHLQNFSLPAGQFPAATSNALSVIIG